MPASFSFSVLSGAVAGAPSTSALGSEAGAAAGRDFKLDAEGDLSLEEGDFVLLAGADAVASDLRARLQTFLGEWFLDTSIGVPYFTEVYGKTPAPRLEAIFREEILKTPGVSAILSLQVQKSSRTLSVRFRVSTDLSEIIDAVLEV